MFDGLSDETVVEQDRTENRALGLFAARKRTF
jgi:hypothetical protein